MGRGIAEIRPSDLMDAPELPKEPLPASVSYLDLVPAVFRQEHIVGAAIESMSTAPRRDKQFDYNPFENLDEKYWSFDDEVRQATDDEHRGRILARIDRELADQKLIADAGISGTLLSMGVSAIDPIAVATMFAPVAKAKSVVGAAGKLALASAAAAGVQEAALQNAQVARPWQVSMFNVGGAALLGGVLGGSFKAMEPTTVSKLYEGVNRDAQEVLTTSGILEENPRIAEERHASGGSAKATIVDDADAVYRGSGLDAVPRILRSPLVRGLTSMSSRAAKMTSAMFRHNFREGKVAKEIEEVMPDGTVVRRTEWVDAEGGGINVETAARRMINEGAKTATKVMDRLFAEYGRTIGHSNLQEWSPFAAGREARKTRRDFEEAVGRAMRRGDVDPNNPFVEKAAKELRPIFANMETEMKAAGMLPPDAKLQYAKSYFPRIFNFDRIRMDTAKFRDFLITEFEKLAPEVDPVELAKGADDVIDRMLGGDSNSMITTADLVPNAGALKGRTLPIADEALEPWLVSGALEVVSKYLSSVAPRVAFMKRFGGGPLTKIREEAAKLVKEETKKAFETLREGYSKAIDAAKAVRDKALASVDEDLRKVGQVPEATRKGIAAAEKEYRARIKSIKSAKAAGNLTEEGARKAITAASERLDKALAKYPTDQVALVKRTSKNVARKMAQAQKALKTKIEGLSARVKEGKLKPAEAKVMKAEAITAYEARVKKIAALETKARQKVYQKEVTRITDEMVAERNRIKAEQKKGLTEAAKPEDVDTVQAVWDEQMRGIRDEYTEMIQATQQKVIAKHVKKAGVADTNGLSPEQVKALNEELGTATQKIVEDMNSTTDGLTYMRDGLFGVSNLPRHSAKMWTKFSEVVKAWTFMARLGMMTVGALPDIGRLVMENGLSRTLKSMKAGTQFFDTVGNAKGVELREELRRMGIGIDMILGSRLWRMTAINEFSGGMADGARLEAMTGTFGNATGINHWNTMVKTLAGIAAQDKFIAMIRKASATDLGNLSRYGITRAELDRMAKMVDEHGEDFGGLMFARTDKWTDRKMAELFENALLRDVDTTIVTPGAGNKPIFASGEFQGILFQFKSFMFAAHDQVMLATAQRFTNKDYAAINGMVTAAVLGMGSEAVRLSLQNRGDEMKKYEWNDWLLRGIDRGALATVPFEAFNITDRLTSGSMSKLLGARAGSRYYHADLIGSIGAPGLGMVEDVVTTLVPGENGYTQADINAIRRLLPTQNLFYVHWLWTMAAENLGEGLDLPKDQREAKQRAGAR